MSKRKVMIAELGGGKESSFDEFKNTKKKTRKNHESNARHYSIPFIRAGSPAGVFQKVDTNVSAYPMRLVTSTGPLHRAAELDKDSFLMQASRLTFSYEMRPKRTSD